MKVYIGDIVRTERHGHIGRVYGKDQCFKSESEEWFRAQGLSEATKNEPWVSILVDGGGAVYVPESDIAKILPAETPISNPYIRHFFG